MKIKIQISVEPESGKGAAAHEVLTIERDKLAEETLGLTLSEAKELLSGVQEKVIAAQCEAQLLQHQLCPHCGKRQMVKDRLTFDIRTLFGRHTIASPRLIRCACKEVKPVTFSPLAELLPGRTTPELLYIEAKFASLVSYGATVDLLSTLLPVDDAVSTSSLYRHVHGLGERIESEMGDEQKMFTTCSQREMDELPAAGDRLYVSFDGGYVRARSKEKRQDGSMEIITG